MARPRTASWLLGVRALGIVLGVSMLGAAWTFSIGHPVVASIAAGLDATIRVLVRPVAALASGSDDAADAVDTSAQIAQQVNAVAFPQGIASGDVTSTSAVIWARGAAPGTMHVEYAVGATMQRIVATRSAPVTDANDLTATVRLDGLTPDAQYSYRVWFETGDKGNDPLARQVGTFRTAPRPDAPAPLSLIFSADLGGAGYCRRADGGYPIFETMRRLQPDLFLAMGDMIYADQTCPAAGPGGRVNVPGEFTSIDDPTVDWANRAQVLDVYRRHWRYNRADPAFQRLLASTALEVQWDDHEIIDDAGADWTSWAPQASRAGYPGLVAAARQTLFEYSPIDRNPDDPNCLYRVIHWGADADLFLLDDRSYRSRDDQDDTSADNKTMLGHAQLAWLEQGLLSSRATWKIISTTTTLSVPTTGPMLTPYGGDGWAGGPVADGNQVGFKRELGHLLQFLAVNHVKNVVFVSGDVHRALSIRYQAKVDLNAVPMLFHEFVVGPLSAGTPPADTATRLDPTFSPQLLYGESGFFNFGYLHIARGADGVPTLTADVRGEDGQPRAGSQVVLTPQS
jgi:alkaline phosphatase D